MPANQFCSSQAKRISSNVINLVPHSSADLRGRSQGVEAAKGDLVFVDWRVLALQRAICSLFRKVNSSSSSSSRVRIQ